MSPSFVMKNERNKGFRYAKYFSDISPCFSFFGQSFYGDHLSPRKFRKWVALSGTHGPVDSRMINVFAPGNPLQIFKPVVNRVTIQVGALKAVSLADKGLKNSAMNAFIELCTGNIRAKAQVAHSAAKSLEFNRSPWALFVGSTTDFTTAHIPKVRDLIIRAIGDVFPNFHARFPFWGIGLVLEFA